MLLFHLFSGPSLGLRKFHLFSSYNSGDPNKCDLTGNTALHWAALNGHLNCVSFLVSFGVNLWSLNNDYHTAKDCAALSQRREILDYLDQVMAKESALNPKMVQKQKEKAIIEAEKHIRSFEKLQKKASKKAEKEERSMEKFRKKLLEPIVSLPASLKRNEINSATINTTSHGHGNPPKFSEIVNNGTVSNKNRGLAGVSRKVLLRKQHSDQLSISTFSSADSKVPESRDGKKSVRSMTGLRRDDVLYVRKYDVISNNNFTNKSSCNIYQSCINEQTNGKTNGRSNIRDLFITGHDDFSKPNKNFSKSTNLHRTLSEPDFLASDYTNFKKDEFNGSDYDTTSVHIPKASIFQRPGFGSVSFRHSLLTTPGTLIPSVPSSKRTSSSDTGSISSCKNYRSNSSENRKNGDSSAGNGSDSIGSAGSLAQRNATLSVMSNNNCWDDGDTLIEEVCTCDKSSQRNNKENVNKNQEPINESLIVLFLAANGFSEYIPLFQKEKIDLEALGLLTEEDLKSLGMPLGPRKKLMSLIEKKNLLLEEPEIVLEL